MLDCRDVDDFEIEEEDGSNPVIDGCIQLDIGVVEHAFNITRVYLDHKIENSNKVEVQCLEHTKKPI